MKNDFASPPPSPPTPSSPLPVSVGPGFEKYIFSPSTSESFGSSAPLSPTFSPISDNHHTAAKTSPLLQLQINHYKVLTSLSRWQQLRHQPSSFSLDRPSEEDLCMHNSCLKDLLEWLLYKCCSCYTQSASLPSKPRQTNHHLLNNDFT